MQALLYDLLMDSFAESTLRAVAKAGGYVMPDRTSDSDLRIWIFREPPATSRPSATENRRNAFILDCEFLTEGTAWYVTQLDADHRSGFERGSWCKLEDAVKWIADHLVELPTNNPPSH